MMLLSLRVIVEPSAGARRQKEGSLRLTLFF
jgi:hypothetical protein